MNKSFFILACFAVLFGLGGCAVDKNITVSNKIQFSIAKDAKVVTQQEKSKEDRIIYLKDIKDFIGIEDSFQKRESFSVAIIDSGIFPHDLFADRIVAFEDYVYGRTEPYDDNGHGTQIAGIIAANEKEKMSGLCPQVNLIGLKVLDVNNYGTEENIVKALNWVVENKDRYNIRAVNMSIGFRDFSDKLIDACDTVYDAGIVIVSSVGNENDTEPLSVMKNRHVILAGSMEEESKSGVYCRADYSLEPDIYTFGTNIYTTDSNGLYKGLGNEEIHYTDKYTTVTGTSYSAAIITGYVCSIICSGEEDDVEELSNKILDSNVYIIASNGKRIPIASRR